MDSGISITDNNAYLDNNGRPALGLSGNRLCLGRIDRFTASTQRMAFGANAKIAIANLPGVVYAAFR
jgi:hypothetical protein